MLRWKNCVAVVTGASSGIGAAIVKDLVKRNLVVVGLARRVERVEEIRASLAPEQQKLLHPVKCDVSNGGDVKKSFEWTVKTLGGVDILVNNAGIFKSGFLAEMDTKDVMDVINTNVMGIVNCTKEAFKSMKERDVNGHVVLINSIAGHKVIGFGSSGNIYASSKFAVTALTEIYRKEFSKLKTKVKISSISPGLVDTEIIIGHFDKSFVSLRAEDISDAVVYVLGTPPNVQVHELIIKPLGERV